MQPVLQHNFFLMLQPQVLIMHYTLRSIANCMGNSCTSPKGSPNPKNNEIAEN